MHDAPSSPSSRPHSVGRVARLAPYFILGPISGPLTAGVVVNMRGGRPVLASMYGFLLASWLLLAPLEVMHWLPISAARLF
jgi:hypothetical protein